jgi:hypothetical protein
MMRGLLADVNAEGQARAILSICRSADWRFVWDALDLRPYEFSDFGLNRQMPDVELWHFCQNEKLILVTGNRNAEDATSLDAAVRQHRTASSLPIVTIGDMRRILQDRTYLQRATEQLLEFLTEMETHLGTGRIYIP